MHCFRRRRLDVGFPLEASLRVYDSYQRHLAPDRRRRLRQGYVR